MAFINILKALTPAATLLTALALGRERASLLALTSTLLIGLGTGIATTQEAASASFSWLAFASFAVSIGFESMRVVLVEGLGGELRYNALEVLAYIGPMTWAFLAAGAAVWEWEGLTTGGVRLGAGCSGACCSWEGACRGLASGQSIGWGGLELTPLACCARRACRAWRYWGGTPGSWRWRWPPRSSST